MEIKQPLDEPKEKVPQKPLTIGGYKKWLDEQFNIEVLENAEVYYAEVRDDMIQQFNDSPFWVQLRGNLREYDQEYLRNEGYPLVPGEFEPQIEGKPFESLLLKTFRKNVLENANWPKKPRDGWILPKGWFTMIDDIVRTLFITKYIDGVAFLTHKIESLCAQCNIPPCRVELEAREEGYYAAHIYIRQPFEIPTQEWNRKEICSSVEIQVTTQLQEVIRTLLHKYYTERRKRPSEERPDWKWNYESPEFLANYLGHVLHCVEGMIMEVRKQQKGEIL